MTSDRRDIFLSAVFGLACWALGAWTTYYRPLSGNLQDSTHVATSRQSSFSPKVYGHVHMAKTGGTTINGNLAARFQGVCGNKGYSYDAYQFYARLKQQNLTRYTLASANADNDAIYRIEKSHNNRGDVRPWLMNEIGFEECDYISLEVPAIKWRQISLTPKQLAMLELHVPCRKDPVDHLMSMCNYRRLAFDCTNSNLTEEINSCILGFDRRYKDFLLNFTSVKCFNPIPVELYIKYMSKVLMPRRTEAEYIHRSSNRDRNKTSECVWNDSDLLRRVRSLLVNEHPYFRFCRDCLGTKDDLLAMVKN